MNDAPNDAFTLEVDHTWDGRPVWGSELARLEVATEGDQLVVSVSAPRGTDAPPSEPPGSTRALWEHEVVELFIAGPDGHYTEIELGPWGHHLVLKFAGRRRVVGRVEQVDFTARTVGDRWFGEMRLDLSHLPAAPHVVNAYAIRRDDAGARRHYAAFPAVGDAPDFHRLEFFQSPEPPRRRTYDRGARQRLSHHDARRFLGPTLFDRLARVISEAECLPRKELFESWEVARRVRRLFRGGHVVDLASGHGLVAYAMLLLDDSSASAVCVDLKTPPSAQKIATALERTWPRLRGRVERSHTSLSDLRLESTDLAVAVHACGTLTDDAIERVIEARCQAAFLPCCHDLKTCSLGGFQGWVSGPMAVDLERVNRLRQADFEVTLQTIPEDISPQNRLILASPNA